MHKRLFLVGIAVAILAACAPPQQQAAQGEGRAIADPAAIIRPLYDRYLTPGAQFPDFRAQAPWSNDLWAELEAMSARSEALNEPILDFDPIIGAQDYQLSNLNVATEAVVDSSHAVVRAAFDNMNVHQEVVYDLVWEDDRWKVDNIRGDGWDMRQIAAAPNADVIAQ